MTTQTKPKADIIDLIFRHCLFGEDELIAGVPKDNVQPVIAHGVIHPAKFHPARVEQHREEIIEQLRGFPHEFYSDTGGGWSFLNFAFLADGSHWGEHINMEQLMQLGEAIGKVRSLLPPEMWDALPGGMPYIVIDGDVKQA